MLDQWPNIKCLAAHTLLNIIHTVWNIFNELCLLKMICYPSVSMNQRLFAYQSTLLALFLLVSYPARRLDAYLAISYLCRVCRLTSVSNSSLSIEVTGSHRSLKYIDSEPAEQLSLERLFRWPEVLLTPSCVGKGAMNTKNRHQN